jgi:superfamily II DNA or RNA helicase
MVQIIIGNNRCKLVGLKNEEVRKKLDLALSYQVQGFQFMRIKSNWDGRYRLLDKRSVFPIGLLPMAENILRTNKVEFQTIDNRDLLEYSNLMRLDPQSGFDPRDYQIDLVDRAWEVSQDIGGGIVRAATGAGKTLCIAMIAAKFGIKTVIYVIGIELLYQMKETIERAFPHIKVGMVGDGHCDVQDVTICTIWSAASAFNHKAKFSDSDLTNDSAKRNRRLNKESVKKMVRDAQMIIVDECQYAASATVQFLHKESGSAKHRFLFSGTPWRETGDDILIESVGGPKFFDMNASKLINAGWLVPPEIHFVNVPMMRGVGKTYHEVYNNYIVNNEIRNNKILSATKKLVATGKKVLVLVTKLDHGKILLDLFDSELRASSLDGRNKTVDRLGAIKDLQNGDIDVLIASKIFDQGIDIPELDALVLAGSGKSSARALQRIGRVIRKMSGKDKAIVVDFWDNCKYLREHSEARYRIYLTEPAFKIKLPKR